MSEAPVDLATRLRTLAGVIAPTTVVTALLFYFGYVATLARFRYFGVYLDLVGLSNQQLLLYGVEVVYVPIVVLAVAAMVALGAHAGIHWLLSGSPERVQWAGWAAATALMGSALLLARGMVGVFVPAVARDEYPATTPLALTAGAGLAVYGWWILLLQQQRSRPEARARSATVTAWSARPVVLSGGSAAAGMLAVAGLFWAANSFASALGSGHAIEDAGRLSSMPEVVLDTAEPLYDLSVEVERTRTTLPAGEGARFHYRYRGLRLLVAAGGHLFLVPATWQEGVSRTLVVPDDDTIRMQLVPAP